MKNYITISLAFLAIANIESNACTCDSVGNFKKVSKGTDLIALIKVIKYEDYFSLFPEVDSIKMPMSVKVELVEVLKGKTENREIKIFGDNGYLCRESIQHLNPNEYYIVAIHKTTNKTWDYGVIETENDYMVSSCGEYVIKYNQINQTVSGRIISNKKKDRTISYHNLKKIIKE